MVLYFLFTSLLQNPYPDTNNLYIVRAKKGKNVSHSEQFWPPFADRRFKFGARSALNVSGYVASFWAMEIRRGTSIKKSSRLPSFLLEV